jgi:hypothetical protein
MSIGFSTEFSIAPSVSPPAQDVSREELDTTLVRSGEFSCKSHNKASPKVEEFFKASGSKVSSTRSWAPTLG